MRAGLPPAGRDDETSPSGGCTPPGPDGPGNLRRRRSPRNRGVRAGQRRPGGKPRAAALRAAGRGHGCFRDGVPWFLRRPRRSGDTRSGSGALPGRHGGLDGGRAPALRPHRDLDARASLLLLAPGPGQGDRGGSQTQRGRRRSRGSPVTHQPSQRGHPGTPGRGGAPPRRRNIARGRRCGRHGLRPARGHRGQHARDGRGPPGRLARRQRTLHPDGGPARTEERVFPGSQGGDAGLFQEPPRQPAAHRRRQAETRHRR